VESIIRKIGREELEILFQMSSSLSSTLELSKILNIIIESAKTLLKAEASSLLLLDEITSELYFASASGEVSAHLKNLTVPMDKGRSRILSADRPANRLQDQVDNRRTLDHYRKDDRRDRGPQ
jgi:hypothetical protein